MHCSVGLRPEAAQTENMLSYSGLDVCWWYESKVPRCQLYRRSSGAADQSGDLVQADDQHVDVGAVPDYEANCQGARREPSLRDVVPHLLEEAQAIGQSCCA